MEDPHADSDELQHEYGFGLTKKISNEYDAVIITVPHKAYISLMMLIFAASQSLTHW